MHTLVSHSAMSNIALPMYDLCHPHTRALLEALQAILADHGLRAEPCWPGDDLLNHWQRDDLLLSQTCGYPLMTTLSGVQTVGCFHYLAPGCEGIHYRSLLVAREADRGKALADFRGRRAVCNAVDSQSGYNALRYRVAQLPGAAHFFSHITISGSHRQSLVELQQEKADLAAIDCVTYALLQRDQPALLTGLAVIGQSPLSPGLPLITARQTPAKTVVLLQSALRQLVSDVRYQERCAAALIGGFSPVTRQAYVPLLQWRDEAATRGVTQL
ncbi:ABC superfamily ATP binding cassette transporter, permease protein [Enterobacter sp. FY-07]|uniref:phosphate/phosphite/phosphonate ABC transporter substrate-binding protein n=1 Tax=Kosakonia oryzendophytica TaxID=1005665 RepID=UPI000776F78E|nr:ABC superfamily ATP binding cassette transporter, permease protein [Enterobacter sp. FY-07]